MSPQSTVPNDFQCGILERTWGNIRRLQLPLHHTILGRWRASRSPEKRFSIIFVSFDFCGYAIKDPVGNSAQTMYLNVIRTYSEAQSQSFKRRRRIFSMLSEKLRGFDLQRIGIKKPADVPGSALPAVIIGLFVAFGGILFGYALIDIGWSVFWC